ncbi:hypothetical protein MMC13_003914 [Lambiella insularis]|nr:hypothetical protein [Lambiella insularis]
MASRPPPSLAWLTALKASQLKALATATGLPSTGTKPILTTRLLDSLPISKLYHPAPPSKNTTHRILSIDMGIRNLAYCQLALPPAWLSTPTTQPPPPLPLIQAWTRLAISTPLASAPAKEAFDPPTLAPHALSLLTTLVLAAPAPPTTILIERQRFRSMGGSAVQEWTLRVNMFEAMLYAVLHTLRAHGLWRGGVHAVSPGRVQGFWLGGEGNGRGVRKAKWGKEEKVRLVERWLQGGGVVELEGEAEGTGRRFLGEGAGRKRRTGEGMGGVDGGKEKVGKRDDLADCLLQGMAWVKWEENRRRIVEEGEMALEGLERA